MIRSTRRWSAFARSMWRASPWRCAAVLLTLVIDIVGQPAFAVLLAGFTDAALRGDPTAAGVQAVLAASAWAAVSQSRGVRNQLRNDVRDRVGHLITEDVMRLTATEPRVDHLEDPRTLDHIDRVSAKGYTIADTVWAALEVATITLTVALTLFVMSTVSPALLLVLPVILITLWLNKVGQDGVRRAVETADEPLRVAGNLLRLSHDPRVAGELRVTGAGGVVLDEHQRQWAIASRVLDRAEARAGVLLAAGWLVYVLAVGAGLVWAATQIDSGGAGAGDLVMILAIARQQQLSVQMAVNGFSRMSEGVVTASAYDVLRSTVTPAAHQVAGGQDAIGERLHRGIALRDVSFTYPGTSRPVLTGLDLELPAGTMVALVGAHGSGKTSVIKLLTGMHAPTSGRIEVDGRPLDAVPADAWRARTAAGFQDFVRLQALARESVGVGDLRSIDDLPRIEDAIRDAGAEDVVAALPEGPHTQLGTAFGGVDLSGGQWQKIALARSHMRQDPLLVVLDEPTAALDPLSESDVYTRQLSYARAMARRSGTVTVVVSHRFSTVRMADLIIVLDRGAVVEQGDHDHLMAARGTYARLYTLQRDSYVGPASDSTGRAE
jgi:ATP-binding cassette subfamily B protein